MEPIAIYFGSKLVIRHVSRKMSALPGRIELKS